MLVVAALDCLHYNPPMDALLDFAADNYGALAFEAALLLIFVYLVVQLNLWAARETKTLTPEQKEQADIDAREMW